jgi:hypothetical protein
MRNFKRLLATFGVVAAITILAGSAAFANDSHRLSLVKNCGTWPTTATCVITSSTPLGFLVGSVITYGGGPSGHPLALFGAGTDVQLVTANGRSSAPGFCQMNGVLGLGHCTFSSGTRKLEGFSADLIVRSIGGGNWTLQGTYRFDRDDNDENDD